MDSHLSDTSLPSMMDQQDRHLETALPYYTRHQTVKNDFPTVSILTSPQAGHFQAWNSPYHHDSVLEKPSHVPHHSWELAQDCRHSQADSSLDCDKRSQFSGRDFAGDFLTSHPPSLFPTGPVSPTSTCIGSSDRSPSTMDYSGESPRTHPSQFSPHIMEAYPYTMHTQYPTVSYTAVPQEIDILGVHDHHHHHAGSESVDPQQIQASSDHYPQTISAAQTPSLTPLNAAPYEFPPNFAVSIQDPGHPFPQEDELPRPRHLQNVEYPPAITDSAMGSSIAGEEVGQVDYEPQAVDADRESDTDYTPGARVRRPITRRRRVRRINDSDGPRPAEGPRRTQRTLARRDGRNAPVTASSTVNSARRRGRNNQAPPVQRCLVHPNLRFTTAHQYKRHMASCGNPRPFPCLLSPLCNSSFGSKNEWKRHISTQHLLLGFYRCQECEPNTQAAESAPATSTNYFAASHRRTSSATTSHNDFNRKDLFTQHLRRMHPNNAQASSSSSRNASSPTSATAAEWETRILPELHRTSWHQVRTAPDRVSCTCTRKFSGESAWEDRVECLGRHFNGGAVLDGGMDEELVRWMESEGLLVRDPTSDCGWAYGRGERIAPARRNPVYVDEDAEGVEDTDAEGDSE